MDPFEAKVDQKTGNMTFPDEAGWSKKLPAHEPAEIEARAAAMKMAGLAMLYFETSPNSAKAVTSAANRMKLENEIEKTLDDPAKALKTAEYLEKLYPNPKTDEQRIYMYNEGGTANSYTYIPDLVVKMNPTGELTEICFGKQPFITKTGASPYTAVCAERKEK